MKNKNNILHVVRTNLCTGCGTCIALCPANALSLDIDYGKGIYVPSIDQGSCTGCSICLNVCPGVGIDLNSMNLHINNRLPNDTLYGNYINNYIGFSTDEEIRFNSSSGGLVTSILLFALDEGIIDGALVTRMKKDSPLEPEPFIARTKKEIIEASGSKYCPVPLNIGIREILNSRNDEKFAVVGLPCHIQGIRNACRMNSNLNNKIAFTLGLFCAKVVSFLGHEFLFNRFKIDKTKIQKIQYRGEGWPGGMKLKLSDYEIFFEKNEYYRYFTFFEPWRCTVCFDPACTLSDISLGDAWIPKIKEQDRIGTSIIVSRSDFGESILNKMLDNNLIKIAKCDLSEIMAAQNNFTSRINGLRARYYINSLLGKEVPFGYYDTKIKPTNSAIAKNCIYYMLMRLALNRNAWFIINIFHKLRK